MEEDSFDGVRLTLGCFEAGLLPPLFCVTAAAIIIMEDEATAAAWAWASKAGFVWGAALDEWLWWDDEDDIFKLWMNS
jgi:hypothetical protein